MGTYRGQHVKPHGEQYLRLHVPGHDKEMHGTHFRGNYYLHFPEQKQVKHRKMIFCIWSVRTWVEGRDLERVRNYTIMKEQ